MKRTLAALALALPAICTERFVTVEPGVEVEVLDWGGTGRAVVLLAGSGNTAHVFDDFAPKVARFAHVYGITRRGYGASSRPDSGYDDQRLADDVLAVIKALNLDHPFLVGHSMAGGELTTLGNQHSELLGGLVYLDALGDPRDWPGSDPAYMAVLNKLPPGRPEKPLPFPESERRAQRPPSFVHNAVGQGQKKRDYSGIRAPVVALFDFIRMPEPFPDMNEDERQAIEDFERYNPEEKKAVIAFIVATKAFVDRWVANLKKSVPNAKLVDTRGGRHYVFLTRESLVLAELRILVGRAG
jgi:pimeloyl-ACP methyl ester carboxylesterase